MIQPGDQLGHYAISSEIARGGMGAVFSARDERIGRVVALKVIAPELAREPGFAARFHREMRIAATLEHPNAVPVYEAGEVDGTLFIAMQQIRGTSLADEIAANGPLATDRVARLARQLGSVLDAAHARGLIHRDVKPANVLLTGAGDDEHLYLADFGLARDVASTSGVTQSGQWIGTLDFVAPEILDGTGDASSASDEYAMGCTIYQALTGDVPFPGPLARKLAGHASDPLPGVGPRIPHGAAIDAVLARGTAKAPESRYASAGALAAALADAARGAAVQDTPATARHVAVKATALDRQRPAADDTAAPTTTSAQRKSPMLVVALVVGVLVAGGAAAWALSRTGGSTPTTSHATSASPATTTTSNSFRTSAHDIGAALQPSLDALAAAARAATPTDSASLATLRESAERALSDLGSSMVDLRSLDVSGVDRADARTLERAMAADSDLARALAARRLSTAELESLAATAASAAASLTVTALPDLDVSKLIAAIRADRRRRAARDANGDDSSGEPALEPPSYVSYSGRNFQAQVPSGTAWTQPVETEKSDGRIIRTTIRGPDGTLIIIDSTPSDPAIFGKAYLSRQTVEHPQFDTAVEYVFQGSKVPECNSGRCVDYIMNDGSSGPGFAVLGGGSDLSYVQPIARAVMESIVPTHG